jgi:hypothetical protein
VEVAAVAGQVAERLRHERGDAPVLLRERVHHVAEEDGAVAARERVRVGEVLLELAVRVLVVVRVVAPAELVDVARDAGEELVVARQPVEVVAGLLERVERVGQLDGAVRLPHEEVLELQSHHELEPLLARLLELAAQNRARVVGPFLALDVDVAGEPSESGLPGHRRVAREVGHGGDVRVARQLADLPGGEAGEARALRDEIVQVLRRHELGARPGVHVDELGEVELHAALVGSLADVVEARRGGGCRRGHGRLLPRSGFPRRYRGACGAPMAASYK